MSTSSLMATLKTLLAVSLAGFAVGAVVATMAAPSALAWYSSPDSGQSLCDRAEIVHKTTTRLVTAQLSGGGVGAAAGIALWIALARRAEKKRAAAPAAPTAAA